MPLTESQIRNLFSFHYVEKVHSIHKIEIGFSNAVFSINDRYILKVCKDVRHETKFEKEPFFYDYFRGEIPIPNLLVYDDSKELCDFNYLIYPQIQGVNLYSKWHVLNEEERRSIIQEICAVLKYINAKPIEGFVTTFNLNSSFSWQEKIVDAIKHSLGIIEQKQILKREEIDAIHAFVSANKSVLIEQDIRIVYWDIHFDNVIVQGNRLAGIIDFERTELCSIDFVLDVVRRMLNQPTKYANAQDEKHIKSEDYSKLLTWYEAAYPELFAFQELDLRLDLYSIKHDLDTLIHWPDYGELKDLILKTVKFR